MTSAPSLEGGSRNVGGRQTYVNTTASGEARLSCPAVIALLFPAEPHVKALIADVTFIRSTGHISYRRLRVIRKYTAASAEEARRGRDRPR